MRLKNKYAVITGAATGIGAATAGRFAEEGASVLIADINDSAGAVTAERIRQSGGNAFYHHTDVSDPRQISDLIADAIKQFGRIDILHNNAACFDAACPLAQTSLEQWEKVININLRSVFLTCREAIPHMVRQGQGVIINTASVLAAVGDTNFAAYIASKGGIAQLTRSIAVDYGKMGIRANALCPGITASESAQKALDNPDRYNELVQKTVLARVAQPREIANAALFLASDEASYVTGSCLFVDGGWTSV